VTLARYALEDLSTAKRLARGGVAYGAVDPVACLRPFRR
jgi:hypothetical protein